MNIAYLQRYPPEDEILNAGQVLILPGLQLVVVIEVGADVAIDIPSAVLLEILGV